jgi:hypothetical protein
VPIGSMMAGSAIELDPIFLILNKLLNIYFPRFEGILAEQNLQGTILVFWLNFTT